jgi:multidrug efflux pump subunit AcrA (membrane-fusion protein)
MTSALVRVTPDPQLRAGQAVHLYLQPEERDRSLLQLPVTAIVDPGGMAPYVLLVVENEGRLRVQRIAVEPGRLGGDQVTIVADAGLAEGDRIVVAGQGGLTDGQPVRLLP